MSVATIFWRSNKILCCFDLKRWAGPVRAFCTSLHGDHVIGIDLGTTNSRVALLEGKVSTIIEGESGRAIPSYVAVDIEKNILVGQSAKNYAMAYPQSSFFKMKNLIGTTFDDPQIQQFMSMVPYKIVRASNGDVKVEAETKDFSLPEVYAYILGKLKKTVEMYLMQTVSKAVIAVPAYYTDAQRRHVKAAGEAAGLDVLKVIDEPIAAVIPSCKSLNNGVVAVLDLGGGTFDISILKISKEIARVKARNGDAFLRGEDFDDAVVEYLVNEIKKTQSVDITGNRIAMMRLKGAAEKAKMELSTAFCANIYIDNIAGTVLKPIHVNVTLRRSDFEIIVHHLVQKIRTPCEKCLRDAKLSAKDVTEVILVGGMAKVPQLQRIVEEIFEKAPTVLPDPDEAVAVSAAVLGGLIVEMKKEPLLPNMIPLSLGVETLGGIYTPIIARNTRIPTKTSLIFTTESDNQGSVLLRIFQGERDMASDNKLIRELELKDIPLAPHSVPRIVVTFEIDASGVLSVCAQNKDTGMQKVVKIQSVIELSKEYTRNVVEDAILYGNRDMAKAMLTEARNMALITIRRIENLLLVQKKKGGVSPLLISSAEEWLNGLKATVASEDVNLIQSMTRIAANYGSSLAIWEPVWERQYPDSDESEDDTEEESNGKDPEIEKRIEEAFRKIDWGIMKKHLKSKRALKQFNEIKNGARSQFGCIHNLAGYRKVPNPFLSYYKELYPKPASEDRSLGKSILRKLLVKAEIFMKRNFLKTWGMGSAFESKQKG